MNNISPTFRNKGLFLLITIPVILTYLAVAFYLWHNARLFLWVYLALFVLINFFQSYCCAYSECPYIYGFCHAIGGMTIPASRIARIFMNKATSKSLFIIAKLLVSLLMLGIIALPLFFIKDLGVLLLLLYCLIFIAHVELSMTMAGPDSDMKGTCITGLFQSKKSIINRTSDISSDPDSEQV